LGEVIGGAFGDGVVQVVRSLKGVYLGRIPASKVFAEHEPEDNDENNCQDRPPGHVFLILYEHFFLLIFPCAIYAFYIRFAWFFV
jgi:hypothetical protein